MNQAINIMSNKQSEGYGYVCKSVLLNKSISVYAKAVYSHLCAHAGSTDIAYPSIPRIADDLSCSERKVKQCIQELEKANVIAVERSLGERNKYRILETVEYNLRVVKGGKEKDTSAPHALVIDDNSSAQDALPSAGDALPSAQDAPPPVHVVHSKNNNRRITDKKNNKKNREGEKPLKKNKFKKPSVDEVKDYMMENGLIESAADFQAKKFIHHYETVGWKVGKARVPMQKWKSSVAGWLLRMKEYSSNQKTQTQTGSIFLDRLQEDRQTRDQLNPYKS